MQLTHTHYNECDRLFTAKELREVLEQQFGHEGISNKSKADLVKIAESHAEQLYLEENRRLEEAAAERAATIKAERADESTQVLLEAVVHGLNAKAVRIEQSLKKYADGIAADPSSMANVFKRHGDEIAVDTISVRDLRNFAEHFAEQVLERGMLMADLKKMIDQEVRRCSRRCVDSTSYDTTTGRHEFKALQQYTKVCVALQDAWERDVEHKPSTVKEAYCSQLWCY